MTQLSQILSLARSGSPARAWALFVGAGFEGSDDPKALTLKGRLLKDQAKAAKRGGNASEQMRLYGLAASAYEQAASVPDSYPLINAASLALLAGKPKRAAMLAQQIITLIDDNPDEGENAYWRGATRAEALLLMGQETQARAALSDAILRLPHAWEDHAATIAQFSEILTEQGKDSDWLNRHRPPCSIHYSGIMRLADDAIAAEINAYINYEKPAFAYGSLAAGSDILFAKSFLQYREKHNSFAQLHIILPFPSEEFCQLSVAPFGEKWTKDFHEILRQADSVHIMGLDNPPHLMAIALADKIAMGQAIRNAHNLQSQAKAFTIKGVGETLRPQLREWQDAGFDLTILQAQRENMQMGELQNETSVKTINAMLWVNGTAPTDTSAQWKQHKNGHYMIMISAKDAYETAQKTMSDDREISMIFDIMDNPTTDILERAMSIANISRPHIITCDYNSAMALEFENVAASIEEIGELKSPWGAQSLWRVI